MATVEWDEYQHFARQQRFSIRYENQYNQMFNLARNTVRTYNDRKEEVKVDTDQADAGFFWSLNDRWAFYARALVDLRDYEKADPITGRSEEHTSELQSRPHLVCRLLLEKKKKKKKKKE